MGAPEQKVLLCEYVLPFSSSSLEKRPLPTPSPSFFKILALAYQLLELLGYRSESGGGEGKQEIGRAGQRYDENSEKMYGNIDSYRRVGGKLNIAIDYTFPSWYLKNTSKKKSDLLWSNLFNILVWNIKCEKYRDILCIFYTASPNFIICHNYSTLSKPGNWPQYKP